MFNNVIFKHYVNISQRLLNCLFGASSVCFIKIETSIRKYLKIVLYPLYTRIFIINAGQECDVGGVTFHPCPCAFCYHTQTII